MLDSSTVKTGKIYYEDAYRVSFSARVLSVEGKDVVLDETAFFKSFEVQMNSRGRFEPRSFAQFTHRRHASLLTATEYIVINLLLALA
jgi:hypothetical protein